MYNGIGLQTVRGTGTSGYVQTNKFNLNRRPAKFTQSQNDAGQLTGPPQTKADEGILEHNRKREIERKLLELEIELSDKGYGEEEIAGRIKAKREELLAAISDEAARDRTAETHELAKRKAEEMDKIRAAFGLHEEAKEGQAFDRDLQERLKAERIAEREKQKKAKAKEEKRRKKELKKQEKQHKKAAKKEAKQAAKAAALKAQEEKEMAERKKQQEAERAKQEAEAKAKRQRDLQARLGPKPEAKASSRKDRALDSPPTIDPDDRFAPDPAERYVPRAPTPEEDVSAIGKSPEAVRPPASAQKSSTTAPSSISPTPGFVRRSGTPSPSPAKVADRKRPPPAREPSPERSGPHLSPPPRKRNRLDSASLSPVPVKPSSAVRATKGSQRDETDKNRAERTDTNIGREIADNRQHADNRVARELDRRPREPDRSRDRRDYDRPPARASRRDSDRDRRGYDRDRREYDRDRHEYERRDYGRDRRSDRYDDRARRASPVRRARSPATTKRPERARDSPSASPPRRRAVKEAPALPHNANAAKRRESSQSGSGDSSSSSGASSSSGSSSRSSSSSGSSSRSSSSGSSGSSSRSSGSTSS